MALLISIPKNILWNYIIVDMLSVYDLANLEIATANHKLKAQLQIFNNIQWTGSKMFHLTDPSMEWLCNHQIGIRSLSFTSNSFIKAFINEKNPLSSVRLALRKGIDDLDTSTFRRSFLFLRVLEISPQLKAIHIANCSKFHSNASDGKVKLLKHIAKMCPFITNITLTYCDENVVPYVFDMFPELSTVQFGELFTESQGQTSVSTPILSVNGAATYPNITHIKCDYLSSSLAQLFSCCPNLMKLEITSNDDDEISDDIMDTILSSCPLISYLSICFPSGQGISERICKSIATHCSSNLKHLQLVNCVSFASSMARILAPRIQNLIHFCWDSLYIEEEAMHALLKLSCVDMISFQVGDIRLDSLFDIDDEDDEILSDTDEDYTGHEDISQVHLSKEDIYGISKSCPNVRDLKIKYATPANDALNSFSMYCRAIETLELTVSMQISGEAVQTFLQSCSSLTSLNLRGQGTLSSEAIQSLAIFGHNIRILRLNFTHGYENISSEYSAISHLKQPRLHELMILSVQAKRTIDLQTLSYLAASFGQIRHLDVKARSFSNTKKALTPFKVLYVRLNEMNQLQDYQAKFFSRCISKLQRLSLSSCTRLSIISICAIATKMESTLRSISIDDCDGISDEFIDQLCKSFPSIKITIDDEDDGIYSIGP